MDIRNFERNKEKKLNDYTHSQLAIPNDFLITF